MAEALMAVMTRIASLCIPAAVFGSSAHAQNYPAKPIRFIIATAPGGLLDVLTEGPEQLGARVRSEYEQFRGIVKAAGIEPE